MKENEGEVRENEGRGSRGNEGKGGREVRGEAAWYYGRGRGGKVGKVGKGE